MACWMGLGALMGGEAATATSIASEMASDPKSARSLGAFEELGS